MILAFGEVLLEQVLRPENTILTLHAALCLFSMMDKIRLSPFGFFTSPEPDGLSRTEESG